MEKLRLIILCLITFAFIVNTPGVSSFQNTKQPEPRERPKSEPKESERAIRENKPTPTSARTSAVSASNVAAFQAEFKRIDIEARAQGSTVQIDASGDTERSGQIKVKVTSKSENQVVERNVEQQYLLDLSLVYVSDALINQIIIAIFSKSARPNPIEGVEVKQIGNTPDYEVVKDYTYQYGSTKITVPKGFRYDRASVPRLFWIIVDKDSLSNVAPLFHDFLYRHGGKLPGNLVTPYRTFSREETDRLFLELMTNCGVDYVRRETAYKAVRNFSEWAWKG